MSDDLSPASMERRALERAWNAIDALIPTGPLQGNGCDKSAERNGLILAANMVRQLMRQDERLQAPSKAYSDSAAAEMLAISPRAASETLLEPAVLPLSIRLASKRSVGSRSSKQSAVVRKRKP